MDHCFSLNSPVGRFDVTPDQDCRMVYVERHHKAVAQLKPTEIPSWCFDPETIWFYFGAPESEDKVAAGEKLKHQILDYIAHS
ncbi:MAG: hypothetical protein C5B54_01975 [Acidobacteria bacterium]|nr:MAG: hypothetical protein C5B54_01975 [Acidobacteriota bacterium]